MNSMVTIKFSKARVDFEHPAKGPNHCADCKYFCGDKNACRIVKGDVHPEDWCKKFCLEHPIERLFK